MKFITSELAYLLARPEMRGNLRAFLRYLLLLAVTVGVYSVIFHVLMLLEGQEHTWFTGVYWTLTVMSTLGFGDITFHTDLGRAFSVVVLLSGIVLLLIVLPFAFIRFFYAPWLEAQLRLRAPRECPADASGHVILCGYDETARGLIPKLGELAIPYYVIEPDPTNAASLHADGVSVVSGELDNAGTYQALRAERARLVLANLSDAANTNVTLTVREAFPRVPIVAFAEDKDAVDVIELSGATRVLPLKHRLGEHLASRVTVGTARAHPVGRIGPLVIAEFPVHNTALVGRSVRDTRLREVTGLNVVACWDRGHLHPARGDTVFSEYSVPVVVGTQDQIAELDAMFVIYQPNENPVIVIGGGKVGRATARALKRREVPVHMIEKDPGLRGYLARIADQVFIGDAAEHDVVIAAGLEKAPSVVLSANDDAVNIFLAVYCRRLNPDTRIVSRITHERNLEAIHRAGADYVLSHTTLAVQSLLGMLRGTAATIVGEGIDLISEPVPRSLVGRSIAESDIREKSGLNVVAIRREEGGVVELPSPGTQLTADGELVMFGTTAQHHAFREAFEAG